MRLLALILLAAPAVWAQGPGPATRYAPVLTDAEWASDAAAPPVEGGVRFDDPAGFYSVALPPGWARADSASRVPGQISLLAPDSTLVQVEFSPWSTSDAPQENSQTMVALYALSNQTLSAVNALDGDEGDVPYEIGPLLLGETGGRRFLSQSVTSSQGADCGGSGPVAVRAALMRLPGGMAWVESRRRGGAVWDHADQAIRGVTVRDRAESCRTGRPLAPGLRVSAPPGWDGLGPTDVGGLSGLAFRRATGPEGQADTVAVAARPLRAGEQTLALDSLANAVLPAVLRLGETADWRDWESIRTTPDAVHRTVETRPAGPNGAWEFGTKALVFVVRMGGSVVVGTVRNGEQGASYQSGVAESFAWRLAPCGARDE